MTPGLARVIVNWLLFGIAAITLFPLAWRVRAELTVAILDARRGEIYAGIFDRSLAPLAPEMPSCWATSLLSGPTCNPSLS